MPAPKPHLFLFYGNDTRQSSRAMSKWEELFIAKYGQTTRYLLDADTGSETEFLQRARALLEVQPLFADQTLLVVKRALAQETAKSTAFSKVVLGLLEGWQKLSATTIVLWVDKSLSPTHPIVQWFQTHPQVAKLQEFQVASVPSLLESGQNYVEQAGYQLAPNARSFLGGMLQKLEKEQRLSARLRANETLAVDHRRWWLEGLLETAIILAPAKVIDQNLLRQIAGELDEQFSAFELLNALERANWPKARSILRSWEQRGSQDEIFAVLAILRRRLPGAYASRLMAELEIIIKNGLLEPINAFSIFLEYWRLRPEKQTLIPPKSVWLSTL